MVVSILRQKNLRLFSSFRSCHQGQPVQISLGPERGFCRTVEAQAAGHVCHLSTDSICQKRPLRKRGKTWRFPAKNSCSKLNWMILIQFAHHFTGGPVTVVCDIDFQIKILDCVIGRNRRRRTICTTYSDSSLWPCQNLYLKLYNAWTKTPFRHDFRF